MTHAGTHVDVDVCMGGWMCVCVCAYVMLTPANTCSNTPGRTGKLYLWLGFSLGMWAPDSLLLLEMRAPGLLTGARQFTDGDMLHHIGN